MHVPGAGREPGVREAGHRDLQGHLSKATDRTHLAALRNDFDAINIIIMYISLNIDTVYTVYIYDIHL